MGMRIKLAANPKFVLSSNGEGQELTLSEDKGSKNQLWVWDEKKIKLANNIAFAICRPSSDSHGIQLGAGGNRSCTFVTSLCPEVIDLTGTYEVHAPTPEKE